MSGTILDLTPPAAQAAIAEWLAQRGEPAYRTAQIVPRLWQRPVASWRDATDLPAPLREALQEAWPLPRLILGVRQESRDGTVKYLWRLADGEAIEAVLIPEGARRTLCISSQAGCPLRCAFCATGTMGLLRNLTAWEIAGQVREIMVDAGVGGVRGVGGNTEVGGRPTNIVFMGMGEPLLNWPAVDTALTILNDPAGIGIGARHITVSTVGILPRLADLAKRPEQFRLAISLHAPTSDVRQQLMPIEKKYHLADVIAAAKRFKRRVTFEYVLIADVNDRPEDATALAKLAQQAGAMVNLLPLHPGGGVKLEKSPGRRMHAFAASLKRKGVEAVLRKSRGLDIDAACGQLRLAHQGQAAEVAAQPNGDVHQPSRVRRRLHRADT